MAICPTNYRLHRRLILGGSWPVRAIHFYNGIDESMSIDQSKHSLFGASKAAADLVSAGVWDVILGSKQHAFVVDV